MPYTLVQEKGARATWNAGGAVTFDATPTSGNLLVVVVGYEKTITLTTPSGWTEAVYKQSHAEAGCAIYYKVSNGSETGFTAEGGGAASTSRTVWIAEYSGFTGGVTLSDTDSGGSATISLSCACGSASAPDDSLAIAGFAWDSDSSLTGTLTITDSFTELHRNDTGSSLDETVVASKHVASAETVDPTATWAGTTGEGQAGVIAVFKATGAGGSGKPWNYYAQA